MSSEQYGKRSERIEPNTFGNGLQASGTDYGMQKILKVGNIVGGGKSQGGSVFLIDGLSPSLISGMSHGNVMPFIVEIKEVKDERDNSPWGCV